MHKKLFTAVLALGLLLLANLANLEAQEDSCGAGSDDQWSSFAHDNGQTSASSINVGDPNGVTLAWTRSLDRISNFTNPTVHKNRIYMSADSEVSVYDLLTGAPVGAPFFGFPEIGESNRGNTTVSYIAALGRDVIFATGGNFIAISALETNLESSPKIWSNHTGNFATVHGAGLAHQNRFNTSKVVEVAGTQVLFVCTEPAAGTGLIYAFDAATGALYPGWGTNPVVLNAAAKHGPAVNGGKLYVGTAVGGTNVNGSLYQIDAATGAIDWNFVGVPGEGWPSGVSTEGDFVYGATRDAGNNGYRYKIDVSGAAPVVAWTGTQGVGLYGTPTIGRNSVYFPLDIPSFGLLQVDKGSGNVAHNFADENLCGASPFMIPLIVTLSCDGYLFAGDRNSRWWLLNAVTGEIEWYRQFPVFNGNEVVSGTALATDTVSGEDYAIVANRQLNGSVGQISAYKLNSGARPRLIQCVNADTVLVPLGTGPGNPRHIDDVFMNIGNAPLNLSALTITDPLPNALSSAVRNARTTQHMSGNFESIDDGEFSYSEVAQTAPNEALVSSRPGVRSMAASASMIRTSAVMVGGAAVPTVIGPGGTADLDWVYDGTGLGGGRDRNDLEFGMDDPDFVYNGSVVATFRIVYQGPCACDCHSDPVCDGIISNIQDVVATIGAAFRNVAAPDPNPGCPLETTDVDCSGFTSVVDVVRVIDVTFRNINPANSYCVACQ
jgi:outer membrane protein assembly factor BamB